MPYTQDKLDLQITTPLGQDALIVRGFNGEERLSSLFWFQLELASEDQKLDFSKIVGKNATLAIGHPKGTHPVCGLVARFVQAGSDQRLTTYYAELRPWLWLLTLASKSRIFQEKTAPEIIEEVFGDFKVADFKLELSGKYPKREYCVQYQESDFEFVSRLMEDEGIFYYFDHQDGAHTMVLSDDSSKCKVRENVEDVPVRTQGSSIGGEPIITHCALEQQVTVTSYAMDDFNFEQPKTALDVTMDGDDKTLKVFEYPGGYTVKGDGDGKVQKRVEAFELPGKLLKGQGHVKGFATGFKFKLTEHLRKDVNAEYILRWVSHSASQSHYSNTFEAFPADVPFRSPRVTRKPAIYGAQTGMVVGKSGEEIFTDKYGRVKVKFHWDNEGEKDEKASCWIRVSHNWAGKGWGSIFIPRIGQEVVVTFLDGDPDRPLITGAVYNADHTVPYALPGAATKSTIKSATSKGSEGFNEIRIEDKKDAEEIYIHAQKDLKIEIENDYNRETKNDEIFKIKNDRKLNVLEGNETYKIDKGNREFEVTKGNETYHVEGTRDVSAKGDESHKNDGNFDHKVGGNYVLKVQGDITIEATGNVKIKAGQNVDIEGGLALNAKSGTDLSIKAGTGLTAKGGTQVKIEGGISVDVKGSAMGKFDGGGMLELKGGLVKIN